MPRVAGMFMLALGGLVGIITYYRDYKYYLFSIVARTGIVIFLFWMVSLNSDPVFIVLSVIVLIGLIPSYWVFAKERMGHRDRLNV